MDSFHKNTCPNCSQFYKLKSLSNQPKGNNLPLYLTCGHTMCECCINNLLKFPEPIECKICHRDMQLSPNDVAMLSLNRTHLYEIFPINMAMLGELTYMAIEQKSNADQDTSQDHFIDLQSIIRNSEKRKEQCLECHNPTSKMCKQCGSILCDACFNKIHKNFIIFKNHELQDIEEQINKNLCKVHSDKPLDYYCKDCSKSICMDCMMVGGDKSCKNHNIVSMQEVNGEFIENLNDISPKVDETFRRLTKTAVDVGQLLTKIENDSSTNELVHMIADIEQHFSKLNSKIQKHKQEVISIVNKLKSSEQDSLQKVKMTITDNLKKTKQVLNSINKSTDPKKRKQINLAILLEDAKDIIDSPWYLTKDESNKDALKVAVNEDLCALISDYIHLEGNANSMYKLRSTTELGEDVEIPPPPCAPVFPPAMIKDVRQIPKPKVEKENTKPPSFFRNVPKYRSKSGSVSSLNSLSSESSINTSNDVNQKQVSQPVVPFEENSLPKQLYEGSQELIYISHIVDPHNFYVQRACHQGMVKEMLREFRNAISSPKPSINHVAEGKTYLAFNKADNMWQRCRVVGIDRTNINKIIYQVFCFDFGSTEFVTIDKLRLLPSARLQTPYPLAINCSLANCEPKNGSWTSDDSFLIQNIIDNKQAVIHIRHIRPSSNFSVKLECDVITFEDGISLAHALVFHERARMPNPKLPYPKRTGIIEKPKLFMGSNDFKPKSVEDVYITHVVSPDKFFVRKQHLQNVFTKLSEDLEQDYNTGSNTGTIYLPEVGMVCVVNTEKYMSPSEHGNWARAMVLELPGRGRVRLLLPDTGVQLLVHWTALRRIRNKWTTLRALATEVHLAGVTPLNKKWSPGSVALLQKFEGRILEMHVEDSRNRDSIGVSLYDKTDSDNEMCINTEMIKYKFAVSFGLYMFNKNVEDQVITNKPLPKTDASKTKSKPKPEKVILTKKMENKIKEGDLEARDKGPLRLEAKVLYYQSPSLLYVSLVHQQKAFNELYDRMQKHYTKQKTESKSDWKIGDRCCCICIQSQTWRRAVIVELEGENAKVFYSDFACAETVPISTLRELTADFASVGDAAIKCHLCGVIPAVGEEWPSLTKEYLGELLDVYKRVFITRLGNFKDKSMPVEMWVYHTIQGGALEPNKSEWRCLNKKIIEQGLGIPDKTQEATTSTSYAENAEDEMLSFFNVTGSIGEWIQLESLPTKPLNTKSDTENNTTISSTEPEDIHEYFGKEQNASYTVFISDWLPPEPLSCKEFTGVPTYIDNEGVIYLHDVSQQDTLDLIRKALDVRFKNPDPKSKYNKWNVGEPCVALYFLDNRFYRGRILEVNKETSTCLVHYVDYGNDEFCSFANLRKSIALYQIPIQAHKCILSRVRPTVGQWDRQSLDYIHKSIVEKQCFVRITGEPIGDLIPIDLKYDKLWFNDHLVEFEMAVYSDGSKAVVRKFAPTSQKSTIEVVESDSGPDYIVEDEQEDTPGHISSSFDITSMEGKDWSKMVEEEEDKSLEGSFIMFPKNTDIEFMCNITVINDLNVLELSIIHDDETDLLYKEMFNKLQDIGELCSPLNGIFENKACLALFYEDNQWYRASVLEYSESKNQIKVKYVDYGNIEIISLADVRELPEEWTTLPPVTLTAVLHVYKINPKLEENEIMRDYSDVFLDKGPFHAKVVSYNNSIPNVELRDDNGKLVYNKLIEDGIFIEVDSVIPI